MDTIILSAPARRFLYTVYSPLNHPPTLPFRARQEPGPRHRGLCQALEEVLRVGAAREGEVPPGVEEQDGSAAAVYDARTQTRPDDIRRPVSASEPREEGRLVCRWHCRVAIGQFRVYVEGNCRQLLY